MRIWIDSALVEDWKPLTDMGLLYGATTNPLIFERQGLVPHGETMLELIETAQELGLQELQVQLTGLDDPEGAVDRIEMLFEQWPEGLVAKVPLSLAGLSVLPLLPEQMPVTLTAAYEAKQAVLAASLKARYIAPYYGRLLEADQPADQIVDQMLAICKPQTEVLVASIRSPEHLVSLAARGHDCFTLSPDACHALLGSPFTEAAAQAFEDANSRSLA